MLSQARQPWLYIVQRFGRLAAGRSTLRLAGPVASTLDCVVLSPRPVRPVHPSESSGSGESSRIPLTKLHNIQANLASALWSTEYGVHVHYWDSVLLTPCWTEYSISFTTRGQPQNTRSKRSGGLRAQGSKRPIQRLFCSDGREIARPRLVAP